MRSILVLLFLFLSLSAYGQGGFKPGFIIKSAGDTVNGFVKFRTNELAEKECLFKLSKGEKADTYKPTDIAGFGFKDNKFFQTVNVGKSIAAETDLFLIPFTSNLTFLEVLVRGKLSLYRHRNDFIFEKNDTLTSVSNKKTVDGKTGDKVDIYSRKDVRVVARLLGGCTEVLIDFNKFKISEKYLTDLVENYNKCTGEEYIVFKKDIPWTTIKTKIVLGINSSSVNFSSSSSSTRYVTDADFGTKSSLIFGLEYQFSFPRMSDKFSLITGGQFFGNTHETTTTIDLSGQREIEHLTFKSFIFRIPIGGRYTFPSASIKPYIDFGTSLQLDLKAEAIRDQTIERGGTSTQEISEPFKMKGLQIGVWIGAGITFPMGKSDWSLGFRYENTNGFVGDPIGTVLNTLDLDSDLTNLQIILGIGL